MYCYNLKHTITEQIRGPIRGQGTETYKRFPQTFKIQLLQYLECITN